MKKFHLGDILTVITGRLVSERGMEGVYDILNYLTGENLFTHQIPRAMRVCQPVLREKFPNLAGAMSEVMLAEVLDWKTWLAEMVELYGPERELEPLPKGTYEPKDPFEELVEMREEKP